MKERGALRAGRAVFREGLTFRATFYKIAVILWKGVGRRFPCRQGLAAPFQRVSGPSGTRFFVARREFP